MSLTKEEIESLQKILEGKTALFQTIVSSCMLWWVSSVVFCGSVLSTTFLKKDEISGLENVKWFVGIVAFFVLTIVAFGTCVGTMIVQVSAQTSTILAELNMPVNSYKTEFYMFEAGMWLGTSSFVLVFVAWVGLSRELIKKAIESKVHRKESGEAGEVYEVA